MPHSMSIAVAAAIALTAISATAQQSPATATASAPVSRDTQLFARELGSGPTVRTVEADYRWRLSKLRAAMVKQKATDGGQLKADNAARFQRQLDKINRTRAVDLANASRRRI